MKMGKFEKGLIIGVTMASIAYALVLWMLFR